MSDSNSDTSTSTNYSDSRMVLGEGALVATDNGTISNTTNTTTTDFGAVTGAFNFGNNALDFAGGVVDRAFDFGDKTVTQTLNFANDAQADSFAFAQNANDRALNAIIESGNDSFNFAQQVNATAAASNAATLDLAKDGMTEAYAFSGKQTAIALDSLNGSANLVKDAYADAKGRGALTDQILMVAIGMAGIVAFTALRK